MKQLYLWKINITSVLQLRSENNGLLQLFKHIYYIPKMYGGFIENSGGERERYEILVNNLESSCDSVQVQQVTGNIFT